MEEMRKQIRANGVKQGLSEEEIQYTLTEKYKKLPRIASIIANRIVNED